MDSNILTTYFTFVDFLVISSYKLRKTDPNVLGFEFFFLRAFVFSLQ